MTENEFLLLDRVEKIKSIIDKYSEENFYISFSGGKDSTVLSWLIDYALPNNKIPRVYIDTGIEYQLVKNFVTEKAKKDNRIIIISPSVPIKKTLEEFGYPFKSKEHSVNVSIYQNGNTNSKTVKRYLTRGSRFDCPCKLRYQFEEKIKIKISDKCCDKIKKEPLHRWQKENNKPYAIIGVMRAEGGRRTKAQCIAFNADKKTLKSFQPLAPMSKEWEEWLIDSYKIKLSSIYYPPYNFKRTGCKGCPFNPNLQKDLDTLEKYFPAERKQCEYIWKPIYDEYRRIGYRLKK